MTFQPLTDPVDYIELSGRRSPGIAEVLGASTPRDFRESRAYGYSGARIRYRGNPLAPFTVKLRLITDDHWEDWHAWRELVRRPEGTPVPGGRLRAPPLDVWHPILEDLGISQCVVLNVLQPVQTADGEFTIEIRFKEYRRLRFALEQTEGAQAEPTDPAERAIANLTGILSDDGQGDVAQALAPVDSL